MPHRCVHCSKIIQAGSQELLDGCSGCGARFFLYIREELLNKDNTAIEQQIDSIQKLKSEEKDKIEDDVRQILKVEEEDDPVVLDLESVRVLGPGKFELDLVSLLNRKPIVFKLEEGKYIIDIESGMNKKR